MDEHKKHKQIDISELPSGLRELVEAKQAPGATSTQSENPEGSAQIAKEKPLHLLQEHEHQKLLPATPNVPSKPIPLPSQTQGHLQRPKTQKETELDSLISKRQGIIEQLKAKNPSVLESRKKVAALIPQIRGKGAPKTIRLIEEAERLEFSIATEAYTPAKEKDLLKRLRQIKIELSHHKELEIVQKAMEHERTILSSLLSEIRSLEHQLSEARKECDAKYSEVLSERKSAYESRQKAREQHHNAQERRKEQFEHQNREEEFHSRQKEYRQKKESFRREEQEDMAKYMKDYDDTVSLEEIVQIEKKEKRKKGEE